MKHDARPDPVRLRATRWAAELIPRVGAELHRHDTRGLEGAPLPAVDPNYLVLDRLVEAGAEALLGVEAAKRVVRATRRALRRANQ